MSAEGSKSFFDGPIISPSDGLWGDGWITWFLVVHFFSGIGLYRVGLWYFPNNPFMAFVFASLVHLLYEIKDVAAYYEDPLFMKWNDIQYNLIPRSIMSSDQFHESDPSHNYPMNSVLDQVVSMSGAFIAYRLALRLPVLNVLFGLWVLSLVGFNMLKMQVLRKKQ